VLKTRDFFHQLNGKVIPLLNQSLEKRPFNKDLIGLERRETRTANAVTASHSGLPFIHELALAFFHLVQTIPTDSSFTLSRKFHNPQE